jgi:hypothetical protein
MKLLSLFSVYLPLRTLHEADSRIFSTEALKSALQTQIQATLPDSIQESADIFAALEEVEWSDISELHIHENVILQLLNEKNRPFPDALIAPFRKWLEDQAVAVSEEKEDVYETASPEPSRASATNDESLSEEWVETLKETLAMSSGKRVV